MNYQKKNYKDPDVWEAPSKPAAAKKKVIKIAAPLYIND